MTAGHHHRCYRNKATDRYVIEGYRGLEFMDTKGDNHARHNWIRGLCQYGIMPANGMVYLPPHNCGCYPEAKLYGFWASEADQSIDQADSPSAAAHPSRRARRLRQPARNSQAAKSAGGRLAHPSPRFRPQRRSRRSSLPAKLKPAWKTDAIGRLSAPVIARRHAARLGPGHATRFSLSTRKPAAEKWRVTAGGPVDSAPTIHGDTALFGSADGTVTCVRLSDGEMALALPGRPDRPAHGGPPAGGVAVAGPRQCAGLRRHRLFHRGPVDLHGRRMFLYGLDPATGALKISQRLHSPHAGDPEAGRTISPPRDLAEQGGLQDPAGSGPQ